MKSNIVRASSLETFRLLPLTIREQVDTIRYEESLGDFIRAAWHHTGEPQPFQSNWHIDCLSDHLMAVARRELKGPGPLVITMPPRHMKSRGVNVFFPSWVWAQNPDPKNKGHGLGVRPDTLLGPGVNFAHISYVQKLSNDHSMACRNLIESDWYQRIWGDRVRLQYSQIERFDNLRGGKRLAMSFSSVTGFGADIIVIDDAHDVEESESEVIRDHTLRVWDEVLPTRLHPGGMFIVIMHRSHERDLVGHILAKEFNGTHICLPALHEHDHPYVFLAPKQGWEVPRATDTSLGKDNGPKLGENWFDFRKDGEELWVDRFPKRVIDAWSSTMTPHAAGGQLQQRPTAREGGLFKREWFVTVKAAPDRSKLELVRAWDLASTAEQKGDPDYTVGLLMGRDTTSRVLYVLDIVRGRWEPAEVERQILACALLDGEKVPIQLPKDPGQAGKFQAHYYAGKLQGYTVKIEPEVGSKENRADPFAAQCANAMVKLIEAPWNHAFVNELCGFPNAAHDDQVDAASAAFRALVRRRHYSMVGVPFG
jgi:predicted phage terminase large subunit-like protein